MSVPRISLAAGVINNKLFAVGGYFFNGVSSRRLSLLEEYDPIADVCIQKASMPTSRARLAAGVVDGKLYTIGGGDIDGENSEYNPALDIWVSKTPSLNHEYGLTICEFSSVLFYIGGLFSLSNTEYNPVNDSWAQRSPMPTPRQFLGGGAIDGKIYVVGGYNDGSGSLNIVEMYDTATDSWTPKAPMNSYRSELCVCVIGKKIYAIGGYNNNTYEIFNAETDVWSAVKTMPFYFSAGASAVANGKIYLIGGYIDGSPSDKIYEFIP
jgi:hypothetical protein